MPNTIETNEVTHMKTCTQMWKKLIRIQIQNNDNIQNLFFLCALESQRALESQNMKN
jgi:hypothetical protein